MQTEQSVADLMPTFATFHLKGSGTANALPSLTCVPAIPCMVWSSACHSDKCYIVLMKVMHNPDEVYAWPKCFSDLSLSEEGSVCQNYCTMIKEHVGNECGMLSGLRTNYLF